MKMWGEEKPTWRRDIIKKAAQVQLEDWTRKKQPMEVPHGHLEECPKKKAAQVQLEDWTRKKQPMKVPHGHLEECPKNKQLAGVTHDQLEVWSTRSVKRNMPTTAVVQGQLEVWTRRSTAHDQLEVWSRRRSAINELAGVKMNYQA